MNTSPMMNVMVDSNPKLKKKANKAFKTMESVLDTAQYMFR